MNAFLGGGVDVISVRRYTIEAAADDYAHKRSRAAAPNASPQTIANFCKE